MKTLLPVCDLELTKAPNRRKLKTESKSFATLFEKRCLPPVLSERCLSPLCAWTDLIPTHWSIK
tara:strand:- start:1382 stop:1573 length:192 start_codon:yes stop_codon:yes gene_type:complete